MAEIPERSASDAEAQLLLHQMARRQELLKIVKGSRSFLYLHSLLAMLSYGIGFFLLSHSQNMEFTAGFLFGSSKTLPLRAGMKRSLEDGKKPRPLGRGESLVMAGSIGMSQTDRSSVSAKRRDCLDRIARKRKENLGEFEADKHDDSRFIIN